VCNAVTGPTSTTPSLGAAAATASAAIVVVVIVVGATATFIGDVDNTIVGFVSDSVAATTFPRETADVIAVAAAAAADIVADVDVDTDVDVDVDVDVNNDRVTVDGRDRSRGWAEAGLLRDGFCCCCCCCCCSCSCSRCLWYCPC
jgi:hypothetical protein